MASDYGDREVTKDVEKQYKQISLDENEHRLGLRLLLINK